MHPKEFPTDQAPQPIVQGTFRILKMPGKGGWSFVCFDPVEKQYRGKFGVVNVYGTVDSYQLENYGLMPMKTGKLFMAIRADIRKQIGKQEGDLVEICLYPKIISSACEDDLLLCLQDEPELEQRFKTYAEAERQSFIDWVNAANSDEQKVERIAEAMDMISMSLRRPFLSPR